jgi:hypothetical protein
MQPGLTGPAVITMAAIAARARELAHVFGRCSERALAHERHSKCKLPLTRRVPRYTEASVKLR